MNDNMQKDTNESTTPDNGTQATAQPELTASEVAYLETIVNIDREFTNEIEKDFERRGFIKIVRIDHHRHQNMPTDLGKRVLATAKAATSEKAEPPVTQREIDEYLKSQGQDPELLADAFRPTIEKAIRERQKTIDMLVTPATSEKPTTITAREFVEQGYAEKVKRGECGVMDGNKVIVADLPEQILDHLWFQVSLGNSRFNKGYDRNSLFSVTWLPATPPPEQATKPQLSPDEARLLIIRDAFDLSQPIAFAASQLNTMYKEIIELRAERDSMVDELRQLRIQVKKLKRKSNLDDGFIEHLTAKDES